MENKSLFVRRGSSFHVTDRANLEVHDTLPVATYAVRVNPMTKEFYLEIMDNFVLPERLYGSTEKYSKRILDTYVDRNRATGVMLVGEKGSGKSLLAKTVSVRAAALGMPTIVIDSPYTGDSFYQFIQHIKQRAVVMFDEFEKVYNDESQQEILTLFDGVYPTNKLWLVTSNSSYRINTFIMNRPSRMYYYLQFSGLEPDFIREYCEDRLKNKAHVEQTVRVASVFTDFNFDMLQSMVEEMNRYDESPREVIKILNTRADRGDRQSFDVTIQRITDGVMMQDDDETEQFGVNTNPLLEVDSFYAYDPTADSDDDEESGERVRVDPSFLTSVDAVNGKYTFKLPNYLVTYTRRKAPQFNWDAF